MDNLIRHAWRCPYPGCDNPELWSYTDQGLETRISFHRAKHQIERSRAIIKVEKQPPKDYDTLQLTWTDITFLLTRGIAIDDHIMWEGFCGNSCKPEKGNL